MESVKMMVRRPALWRRLIPLLAWSPLACSPPEPPGHAEDAEEHEELEGGLVELTETQLASAGIEVRVVGAGEIVETRTLPAVVAVNADSITHVTPKVPGIVHSIHRHLGEEVAEGDLLSVIESAELGQAVANLVRAKAMAAAAQETLAKEQALFQRRIETAERVLDGAIEVNERIHSREKELQEKAVSTIRPLLEAERELQIAKLQKEEKLTELLATRDARLLALDVDLREKHILADAAQNVLVALGLGKALADGIEPGSPLLAGRYEINAARKGIVSGRHITVGEHVDSATELFTIQDLHRVWVQASVFEGEIREIGRKQRASVSLDAFPGRSFAGEVTTVGFEVDPKSRALTVRVELDNTAIEDWSERFPLRPGMFGSVELETGRRDALLVLPESALVHEDAGEFVFVKAHEDAFEKRAVTVGAVGGGFVEIVSGLEPGEEVAITQTFLLKSMERQGELGGGHSH